MTEIEGKQYSSR